MRGHSAPQKPPSMRRILNLFHFVDPLGTGGVWGHFTCLKTAPCEPAALHYLLLAMLRCPWVPRSCHLSQTAALSFLGLSRMQHCQCPQVTQAQLMLREAGNYFYFENIDNCMKNIFICSSQKHTCRHSAPRRGVKHHELRNEVVRADSTVCLTIVHAMREAVAWSSVPHMSSPPLSPGFLHTKDPVFKEQLHTVIYISS